MVIPGYMMKLCERCKRFDIQAFAKDNYPVRGMPIQSVKTSAKEGCTFCNFLLQNVPHIHEEFINLERINPKNSPILLAIFLVPLYCVVKFTQWALFGPAWILFRARRHHNDYHGGNEGLNLMGLEVITDSSVDRGTFSENSYWANAANLQVAADPGTAAFRSGDVVGRLFSDIRAWNSGDCATVLQWHQECSANHPECNQNFSAYKKLGEDGVTPLPTRCIDVIAQKLCETAGKQGKFIALSHRWAAETPASNTTRANLDCRIGRCNHPSSCDFRLTKTFRDAMALTEKLGIQYIWIDSICIVQDDPDDWKREAFRMCDYYQNAWLTIAATMTTEEGGLLKEYDDKDLPPITRLPYRDRQGIPQGYFYLQCFGAKALSKQYNQHLKSTLLRRGWVLQERLLSRRLLTLAKTGAFFTCRSGNPRFVTGEILCNQGPGKDEAPDQVRGKLGGVDLSSRTTILKMWAEIVESYSHLEITNLEQDRIIALAGMAREFDLALSRVDGKSQRWIAGHWMNTDPDSAVSLLWEQKEPISCQFWRVRGLPTWSWASIAKGGEDETKRGLAVRWSRDTYDSTNTVICDLNSLRTIVLNTVEWKPKNSSALITDVAGVSDLLEGDYGDRMRFATITVTGFLHRVFVRDYFRDDSEAIAAARLTRCGYKPFKKSWRRVVSKTDANVVCGWALIEHPDCAVDNGSPYTLDAFALFVAKVPVKVNFIVKRLGSYETAYRVLYLAPVLGSPGLFQRLGVGRMFGDEVNEIAKSSAKVTIELT